MKSIAHLFALTGALDVVRGHQMEIQKQKDTKKKENKKTRKEKNKYTKRLKDNNQKENLI